MSSVSAPSYAQLVDGEDDIGPGEQLVIRTDYIGGHYRVIGGLHELASLHPTVVEIVIAQSRGVKTEQIGDLEDRQPVEDGRDGRALHQVSGVQQDAVGAAGALVADGRGQVGEASLMGIRRRYVGVQVVGVENGEGTYLRGQRGASRRAQRQEEGAGE
jgi:hypothetical protein